VRSHRHRSIAVDLDSAKGYAAAIVTPGWQGKTPFAFKIAGARISEPQFGGIVIRQGDEEHYYRRRVWTVDRSAEE
jgi:ABC-type thiamine transport system ATPase subunit